MHLVMVRLNRSNLRDSQRGFSMIEVLVTLLIIALALLGTAGLQAYSMRLNQGGQFRTQAVFLVADLAERIEANKAAAVLDGAYAVPLTTAAGFVAVVPTTCQASACSRGDLAVFDLAQWQNAVADPGTLPQSSWTVTAGPADNPRTYTITLNWVDRRAEATNATGTTGITYGAFDATSSVGGNAAATGEKFSYTATRTVFNPP